MCISLSSSISLSRIVRIEVRLMQCFDAYHQPNFCKNTNESTNPTLGARFLGQYNECVELFEFVRWLRSKCFAFVICEKKCMPGQAVFSKKMLGPVFSNLQVRNDTVLLWWNAYIHTVPFSVLPLRHVVQ